MDWHQWEAPANSTGMPVTTPTHPCHYCLGQKYLCHYCLGEKYLSRSCPWTKVPLPLLPWTKASFAFLPRDESNFAITTLDQNIFRVPASGQKQLCHYCRHCCQRTVDFFLSMMPKHGLDISVTIAKEQPIFEPSRKAKSLDHSRTF